VSRFWAFAAERLAKETTGAHFLQLLNLAEMGDLKTGEEQAPVYPVIRKCVWRVWSGATDRS